jgi:hypothetical protein
MAVVYSAIPFGTLLMCLLMIFKVVEDGKTLFSKNKTTPEGGRP